MLFWEGSAKFNRHVHSVQCRPYVFHPTVICAGNAISNASQPNHVLVVCFARPPHLSRFVSFHATHLFCDCLPLGLLGLQETLEDAHNLVEGGEVGAQLLHDLGDVVAKLGVEVLPVGTGAHGGAEDGLDHEAVVGLEGDAVCVAERVGQFLGAAGYVLTEGDAGEFESTVAQSVPFTILSGVLSLPGQPQETLGGLVGLGLELVDHQFLEGFRLGRCGELALSEFLVACGVSIPFTL